MRKMMTIMAGTLLLASCGKQGDGDNIRGADYAAEESNLTFMDDVPADQLPPDTIGLSMKEVMGHVMQYGGHGIWKSQG